MRAARILSKTLANNTDKVYPDNRACRDSRRAKTAETAVSIHPIHSAKHTPYVRFALATEQMHLTDPTDFDILEILTEGRNVPANLAARL